MMEYFKCFYSYRTQMKRLSDEQVGQLFRALMLYAETGEETELDAAAGTAFDFIAADIDAAANGYANKCATNKKNAEEAAAKRSGKTAVAEAEQDAVPEAEPEGADGPVYTVADVIRAIDRESLRVASVREDPEGLTVTAELPESVRDRLDANARERMRTHANATERTRTLPNATERTRTAAKDKIRQDKTSKEKKDKKQTSDDVCIFGRRFTPPTIQEVSLYIADNSLEDKVSAAAFVAHYNSVGWKLPGGRPVEDWKERVKFWAADGAPKDERARNGTKRGSGAKASGQYANGELEKLEVDLGAGGGA